MKKFYGILFIMMMVQFSFAQKVGVPQLKSPVDGFATAMPDAILDWDAVSGVGEIKYQIQLATDENFSSIVLDLSNIQITAYYCENLLFGQEYFWRVKSVDQSSTSAWSSTFSFTTFSAVVLDKPSNNADEQDLRPTFKWKNKVNNVSITGVHHYELEIDTVDTFNSPYLHQDMVSGELFEHVSNYLLFGTKHYWRMRPANANGAGEWSETRALETLFGVEVKSPSNNASNQALDVAIEWKTLEANDTDIFDYTVEVSTDADFTNPVTFITTELKYLPTYLKFNQEYWWRVKAAHAVDASDWSEARKFTTIPKVSLVGPANEAVLETVRPTLEWTAIGGVDGYQVRIAKNAGMAGAIYYTTAGNNYPLPTLNKDEDYYWSVRAYKTADTCEWANNFSFHIPWNVGVNEIASISESSVYPNPATTQVAVSFTAKKSGALEITITDVLGQNVINETMDISAGKFSKSFDVTQLNKGIYFVEIQQNQDKKVLKFVVK